MSVASEVLVLSRGRPELIVSHERLLGRQIEEVQYVELDALHYGAQWLPRSRFLKDVQQFADGTRWVTEWQYPSSASCSPSVPIS